MRGTDDGFEACIAGIGNEMSAALRGPAREDDPRFLDLSAEVLSKYQPWKHFDGVARLRRFALGELGKSTQAETHFSDHQQIIYSGDGFYIEALFWTVTVTSVHQHAFGGAFCVLDGAVMHTTYAYEVRKVINDSFKLGHLSQKFCERISTGDVRQILPGDQFIHDTHHIPGVSVTLVLRTNHPSNYMPQWDYQYPSVAISRRQQPIETIKAIEALTALQRADRKALAETFFSLAERDDPCLLYWIVRSHAWAGLDPDVQTNFLARVRDHDFGADILRAAAHREWLRRCVEIRHRCDDAGAREALAVMAGTLNHRNTAAYIRQLPLADRDSLVGGIVKITQLEHGDRGSAAFSSHERALLRDYFVSPDGASENLPAEFCAKLVNLRKNSVIGTVLA